MLRSFFAVASIAVALAMAPAQAQQAPTDQPPAAQAEPALIGLRLYSSDGQELGEIKEVGKSSSGQQAVRAVINETLGVGSVSVVIDTELFQKKADRIELAMTAAEVKDTISKQQQNQQQQ